MTDLTDSVLRLSPRIHLLPILHGSGDVAQEVRETLVAGRFDCLAVPLPPSFEEPVESAVEALPVISVVVSPEPAEAGAAASFVPVDPCQPVIMGIRVAMGEGIARAYIDREVAVFEPTPFVAPDAYALKQVPLATFASALLPALPAPEDTSQQAARIAWMAFRLHELELTFDAILCLCPLTDWPWLRQAYRERAPYRTPETPSGRPTAYPADPATLYFLLGELPFITELSERRRAEVRSDRHLSIDGIKELLLETRSAWLTRSREEGTSIGNWVTPHLLTLYLRYVRNLALMERRLTPDLYTLVLAAKQMAGDQFAIVLLETAKRYRYQEDPAAGLRPTVAAGIGKLELPDGDVLAANNRLQGPPLVWRSLSLHPTPSRAKSRRWALQWDPYRQCSWPPEDERIESFTRHVREQAKAILGADLARVEKFTTSVKDGIDLRESLRHWHRLLPGSASRRGALPPTLDGPVKPEIYVKEIPPARGNVDVVVFLFDTPADPAVYSWQATWYAEHPEESTLCFYASPFQDNMIGPGIGQSRYGGALFLYPPRPIPNVWDDPVLAFTRTLEERLIAAAALHSREPHIAVVTPIPPRARWRRVVREFNRRLVVIPLARFSGQTVDRLRRFHVLNGHEIRSYAAKFILE
ncbi:hypothetical protein [Candidatus Nitrospira bockiana]